MCWNSEVSLNTFLFSGFVLALIIYNNSFTKYKIQELNNKWVYLFFASFIIIQLIEFFIWRNINNKFYNNLFSIFAALVFVIQPILSMMLLTNKPLRNFLLITYLLIMIPYSIYKLSTKHFYSVISKNGHLVWKYFDMSFIIWIGWTFYLLFSFVYEKKWVGIFFGLISLFVSFINFQNDGTYASIWCWSANSIMIYYAIYLLMYLPFLENKNIC